jgi:hypothetical protein
VKSSGAVYQNAAPAVAHFPALAQIKDAPSDIIIALRPVSR